MLLSHKVVSYLCGLVTKLSHTSVAKSQSCLILMWLSHKVVSYLCGLVIKLSHTSVA